MTLTTMPEAVRLVADDKEWNDFIAWLAQPKPMMLDRNGRNPDVPHELADELFARLISKLRSGEKSAVGFLEGEFEPREIPPIFWATHLYNIWFNLLVDQGRGTVSFTSICVGDPVEPVRIEPTQRLRSAMKAEVKAWVSANPGVQIRKEELREAILESLLAKYPGNSFSKNMFDELWREVPKANKFTSNPRWVAGKPEGKS